VLPARHSEAGNEFRQLPARLRRTVRARVQGRVNRRLAHECSVRGM